MVALEKIATQMAKGVNVTLNCGQNGFIFSIDLPFNVAIFKKPLLKECCIKDIQNENGSILRILSKFVF